MATTSVLDQKLLDVKEMAIQLQKMLDEVRAAVSQRNSYANPIEYLKGLISCQSYSNTPVQISELKLLLQLMEASPPK